MNTIITIKQAILKVTPEWILRIFKKYHYASYLKQLSENEEIEFKILRNLVNPGDRVLDIGANIGVYTKYLADLVNRGGQVYSFEPVPSTFEFLAYNIKKLALNNVELINCAISSMNGWGTMEIPLYESGGNNYYRSRIVDENNPARNLSLITVSVRTIDSLMSGVASQISFIKCDVEGHELNCIKGAVETIRLAKPAWLIEISGNPDDSESSASELIQYMAKEGYDVFWFDGVKLRKRCVGDNSINYFFLTEQHVTVLEKKLFIDYGV